MHRSVAELEATVLDYVAQHNESLKPFICTKTADPIIKKHRAILSTGLGDGALDYLGKAQHARSTLGRQLSWRKVDKYRA